jgi:hypothetical protein
VQLGEQGVKQLPERYDVLCFPVSVVADGCHGPDVTGGGDAVVLGSSKRDVPASARGSGDGSRTRACSKRASVGESVPVVADLGQDPCAEVGAQTWKAQQDGSVIVLSESLFDRGFEVSQGLADRIKLTDESLELSPEAASSAAG